MAETAEKTKKTETKPAAAPAPAAAAAAEQSSLNKFKIEANLSVFGTEVEIKPMDNSEIGYRAPEGVDGISVTKLELHSAGIVDKGSTTDKWIPDSTNVKTIIYDYKKQKVELAVKANFKPGRLPEDYLKKRLAHATQTNGTDAFTAYLKKELAKRNIAFKTDEKADKLIPLFAKQEDDGFILNKYPQAFTVNSVYLYLNMEKSKDAAGAAPSDNGKTGGK